MGKRSFPPLLIDQDAELHVHVGQLRKSVVVTAQRDTTQCEKAFLGNRQHMRFHSSNLVQLDSPLSERRIGNEFGKRFFVDRQNFGDKKRSCFADLCEQILDLPNPRKVFVVGAVLRQLQRRVVVDALNLQIERLFEIKHFCQRLRRFPYSALPVLKLWICPLQPGKILLPFADIGKKMRQVPLVGL